MKKPDFHLLYRGLIFVCVGFMLIFMLPTVLDPFGGLLSFWFGIALSCFGLIDVGVWMWRNRKVAVAYHHKRMRHANRAVVWVWAVALAGICMYAIAFYVLVYPTLEIIGVVEGLTTFDSNATFTLNLVKTVLNWHPIMFIIGLLIWAFVNSQRREDVTYPAY